jgi:cobalamin-dependent methionine synthase I
MLLVGELINASRKSIAGFIESKDGAALQAVAKDQLEAGANFIDVNAGAFDKEDEYLRSLVETVQSSVEAPCCIDSPNPKAIETALSVHKGIAMINSISLEKERCDNLLPILAGTNLKVVALCMGDEGMPETAEQRLRNAERLINRLVSAKVSIDNIFVDPLVQPVATNTNYGKEFLEAVRRIGCEFKGIHTMCGLSNISFGLPNRKHLNQTFMTCIQ